MTITNIKDSNIVKQERKYNYDDFEDLKEIRDYMVHGKQELCIERSKFITRFLKEKGGLNYDIPAYREAESIYYCLKNKKPNIFPNEILAGSTTAKRKGVVLYPEFLGLGIWPELATMSCRKNNKYEINIEEILERG